MTAAATTYPEQPAGYRSRDDSGGDHRNFDDGGRRRARFSGRTAEGLDIDADQQQAMRDLYLGLE